MNDTKETKPETVVVMVQEKPKIRGLHIFGYTIPWIVIVVLILILGFFLYKRKCAESIGFPIILKDIPDSEFLTSSTPEAVKNVLKST